MHNARRSFRADVVPFGHGLLPIEAHRDRQAIATALADNLQDPLDDGIRRVVGLRSRNTVALQVELVLGDFEQLDQEFGVLTDHYLRDYNTRRLTVAFSETIKEPKLTELAPHQIGRTFQRWLENQPIAGGAGAAALIFGMDIGATLTKMQFFTVRDQQFVPIGEQGRFRTPDPHGDRDKKKLESITRDTPPSAHEDARTFSQEVCRRVDEFAYAREEMRTALQTGSYLLCAGVTWPGPVHSGHVAGTSGLLRRFGAFQLRIVSNKVGEILQFDIAGSLKEHLREGHKRAIPAAENFELALLNDADADGYAVLYHHGSDEQVERVAILKLGSGTAAAVFQGRILPGLCEGGKFVLDLNATTPDDYPPGVANFAMSKKFLPAMVQTFNSLLQKKHREENRNEPKFDLSRLDSQELDLFLSKAVREDKNIWPLVEELGLRDLADEEGEDVEVYRNVHYATKVKAHQPEPWLKRRVERKLNVAGDEVFAVLKDRVIARGKVRLAGVLACKTEEVNDLFTHQTQESGYAVAWSRMTTLIDEVIDPSAESLGRCLGDYLVLYHGLYHWNCVFVEGGVMNGATGAIVRRVARERAAKYGLFFHPSEPKKTDFRVVDSASPKPPLTVDPPSGANSPRTGEAKTESQASKTPESHSGCLGAAIYAAGQFLRQQKQKGLQVLRQLSLYVEHTQPATLKADSVQCNETVIKLAQYALSHQDVYDFLQEEVKEGAITGESRGSDWVFWRKE